MTQALGRNDPCHCGSGNKFKKCHGRAVSQGESFLQGEFFELQVLVPTGDMPRAVVFKDGRWITVAEGFGAAASVGFTTADMRYDSPDIRFFRSNIIRLIPASRFAAHQEFIIKQINEICHKLKSVNYHITELLKEETEEELRLKSNSTANNGPLHQPLNEKMIYEMEALLFQNKACLDRLVRILEPTLKINLQTFKSKANVPGRQVIACLENNCPKGHEEIAAKLVELVDQALAGWLEEAIEYRDTITHYSHLVGLFCFMKDAYRGGSSAKIFYPVMPNNVRMTKYGQMVRENLLQFLTKFMETVLQEKVDK